MTLETLPNPASTKHYLTQFSVESQFQNHPLRIKLLYIPDREMVTIPALEKHLQEFTIADSLEALADKVTESIFDALLPCWLRVCFTITIGSAAQTVTVEEAQPGYAHATAMQQLIQHS